MPVHQIETPVIGDGQPIRVVSIPVSTGFPIPAEDDLEERSTRVESDRLLDAGILDGDLIAVDRAGVGRNGRAVLAVVEGAVTAKILRREEGEGLAGSGEQPRRSPAHSVHRGR